MRATTKGRFWCRCAAVVAVGGGALGASASVLAEGPVCPAESAGLGVAAGSFGLDADRLQSPKVALVCGWSDAFSEPDGAGLIGGGFFGGVYAFASFNDGNGSALYAGGEFLTAGGVSTINIAKWNGTGWSALSGPSGNGVNNFVYALAVYDDGNGSALYAAGAFDTAGGVTVNHVAKWNGSSWSALSGPSGTGTSGSAVRALAVYDDGNGSALYAGGDFTTAGGATANYIAKWNGSTWTPVSGAPYYGVNNSVNALTVFNDGTGDALYVGGWFTTAGGAIANYIAKWDGSAWSSLSGPSADGMTSGVFALDVYGDSGGHALYAAGFFTAAGGIPANRIAKWDGTAWSSLSGPSGNGLSGGAGVALSLGVFDDGNGGALYVGGGFATAGGVTATNIAKWDGTAWSELYGPSGNGVDDGVHVLAAYNDGSGNALWVGGEFFSAGGLESFYIGRWSCQNVKVLEDGFESGDTSLWSDQLPVPR